MVSSDLTCSLVCVHNEQGPHIKIMTIKNNDVSCFSQLFPVFPRADVAPNGQKSSNRGFGSNLMVLPIACV